MNRWWILPIPLLSICGAAYFGYWIFYWEIAVWGKPITDAFLVNAYNSIMFTLSLTALIASIAFMTRGKAEKPETKQKAILIPDKVNSDYILETIKNKKPETVDQLIKLIQQTRNSSEEEILNLLIKLEAENKIHFKKKETPTSSTLRAYAFSSNSIWYWATIALAIATATAVFTIPEDAYPMIYLRSALGLIFVLFLPGFTFIKALFPTSVPIKTSSENLDAIERIALSFGMSLALTPIVGLILNYTPWGIRLAPITLSLLSLTVALATVAILREHQTKTSASK